MWNCDTIRVGRTDDGEKDEQHATRSRCIDSSLTALALDHLARCVTMSLSLPGTLINYQSLFVPLINSCHGSHNQPIRFNQTHQPCHVRVSITIRVTLLNIHDHHDHHLLHHHLFQHQLLILNISLSSSLFCINLPRQFQLSPKYTQLFNFNTFVVANESPFFCKNALYRHCD